MVFYCTKFCKIIIIEYNAEGVQKQISQENNWLLKKMSNKKLEYFLKQI
jgi:hypothetical protein